MNQQVLFINLDISFKNIALNNFSYYLLYYDQQYKLFKGI